MYFYLIYLHNIVTYLEDVVVVQTAVTDDQASPCLCQAVHHSCILSPKHKKCLKLKNGTISQWWCLAVVLISAEDRMFLMEDIRREVFGCAAWILLGLRQLATV